MPVKTYELNGVRILEFSAEGQVLIGLPDIQEILGAAMAESAQMVVMPVVRLSPEFFQLRTGLLGELLQKLTNYRIRIAFVGDLGAFTGASKPLRDLIYESNRGQMAWFLADFDELETRLG
jgi:hypothetical protein